MAEMIGSFMMHSPEEVYGLWGGDETGMAVPSGGGIGGAGRGPGVPAVCGVCEVDVQSVFNRLSPGGGEAVCGMPGESGIVGAISGQFLRGCPGRIRPGPPQVIDPGAPGLAGPDEGMQLGRCFRIRRFEGEGATDVRATGEIPVEGADPPLALPGVSSVCGDGEGHVAGVGVAVKCVEFPVGIGGQHIPAAFAGDGIDRTVRRPAPRVRIIAGTE